MQITIRIDQQAAILRGIDAPHSTAKFELNPADLNPAEREWMAKQLYEGHKLDYYGNYKSVSATLEGLKEMIAGVFQRETTAQAQKKLDCETEVAKLVLSLRARETKTGQCTVSASGRARNVDYATIYWPYSESGTYFEAAVAQVPEACEWLSALQSANDSAKVEAGAEARRREQAVRDEDKAEADKAKAIEEFKAGWIRTFGTDNQRGRLAAGLLPDDEIVESITNSAFAPVTIPVYEKLTADDVECECDEYGCDDCKARFDVDTMNDATAEQWDVMESLRAMLPAGCEIELREHKATRKDCEQEEIRYSLRASLPVGPLTVTRDFTCA